MRLDTHHLPGLTLIDHSFSLPLSYTDPAGEQISVFAREVVAAGSERADLPWLVFFQGGPGSASPRPDTCSGWLKRAVEEYRVLLLDQRGTGRSTPFTIQGAARFDSPQALASYLKHFRADSIVADAERIRVELLGERGRWSVLGQSYGGFCIANYLSVAPQALEAAIITGGLPPIGQPAEEVYRATYKRVREKNQRYYERYPGDQACVRAIVEYLAAHTVTLPSGGRLTPRRFQQLGLDFGASDGFEKIHYLVEDAFVQGRDGPELSYVFLHDFEQAQHFERNPIFAILHEAIYCEGDASRWAAERVRAEYPEFEIGADGPILFTGEMIYPWMFDDYAYLRPLKAAAELLANDSDWPPLYDREVLRRNCVPCVATIYYNDMYVERRFAERAAELIQGTRTWLTNEYEHNALRADGERVLGRLLAMLRGKR